MSPTTAEKSHTLQANSNSSQFPHIHLVVPTPPENFRPESTPACPVETTLSLIANRWRVLIVRDLLGGPLRFGKLKERVGNVSQKVLTQNLRAMEADGLLTRTVYPEIPPHVEYELTPLGHSLKPVLDTLAQWGEGYQLALELPEKSHTEDTHV